MKRSSKLISVVLIAAMLLTAVSCAKRRKGAERIQSDGYAKQEAGLETDYSVPTGTDPTETGTEPAAPTPTEPSYTEPDPTITGTNPTMPGTGGDEAYTAEYLFIAGILFVGGDLNTTKMFIESTFGTLLGDPISTDKSTTSPAYTAYTYECSIVADGIEFNNVEIDVCDSTGTVYQVSFINNKESVDKLSSYQKTFADKLATLFGNQLTDKSSGNLTSKICQLESGLNIEAGSLFDGSHDSCWVSFFNLNYLG